LRQPCALLCIAQHLHVAGVAFTQLSCLCGLECWLRVHAGVAVVAVMCITTLMASICMLLVWRLHPIIPFVFWLVLTFVEGIFLTSVLYKVHLLVLISIRTHGTSQFRPGKQQSHPQMHRPTPCLILKATSCDFEVSSYLGPEGTRVQCLTLLS